MLIDPLDMKHEYMKR